MSRFSFAARILLNYGTDRNCPFCGSKNTVHTATKQAILQLRTCESCSLMFRWPKEASSFSEKFYQNSYQEAGFTTELPGSAALEEMKANNFAGSPKDFHQQIAVLKQFVPQGRVLDFGCSWGYSVYQLNNAGYNAVGFEISRPRAELGRRKLGVEILDRLEDLDNIPSQSIDGIFASHVLEHLLSLKEIFANLARILKPGGVLAIMVPNGGGKSARELGVHWPPLINEKHTLALDAKFFEKNLASFGFYVNTLSDPYDPVQIYTAVAQKQRLPAEGDELMVLAQRLAG